MCVVLYCEAFVFMPTLVFLCYDLLFYAVMSAKIRIFSEEIGAKAEIFVFKHFFS